ncbi:MAG: RMD1 family protein [Saprospiraceae bacterium]
MYKVISFQIADSIDIKALKSSFAAQLHFSDSDELFYALDNEQFIYVFEYGVICFINFDEIKISEFIQFIAPHCTNLFETKLIEEFQIIPGAKDYKFGYNEIEIVEPEIEVFRLIMLNVSQSVALDYYAQETKILLEKTNLHTKHLERNGSLSISGKSLTKFIGQTLNLKNRIAENLYIFDSPPETWEDEVLSKVDHGLKRTFDLQIRYRNVHQELQTIKENLELFKDLMQYRKSNQLEWVIVLLILVEVLNLFFEKLFPR